MWNDFIQRTDAKTLASNALSFASYIVLQCPQVSHQHYIQSKEKTSVIPIENIATAQSMHRTNHILHKSQDTAIHNSLSNDKENIIIQKTVVKFFMLAISCNHLLPNRLAQHDDGKYIEN